MKKYIKTLVSAIPVFAVCMGALAQETDAGYVRNRPAASLADALTGLVPWLYVSCDPASEYSSPEIIISGRFSESGTPALVLVDGVEMPIELLDPSVVESVEVLKGGAAAAVYGARAAAGAVVITTRNSRPSAAGSRFIDAAVFTGGSTGTAPAEKNMYLTHNYRLSASGSEDGFSWFFGGNYYGNDGMYPKSLGKSGLHRAGLNANANVKVTEWLCYSMGLDYAYRKASSPFPVTGGTDFINPPYSYADEDRHYAVMRNNFTLSFIEGLRMNLSYSFSNNYDFMRNRSVADRASGSADVPDFYRETRLRLSDSDIKASLDFDRTFGLHHVSASAGADIQTGLHKKVSAEAGNLLDPDFSVLIMGDPDFEVGEKKNRYMQCGLYADAGYVFNGLYSARLTFREDGTSRFAKAHRWAPSYAAELGWNISQEEFFSVSRDVAGSLRLRYGFASVANQNIDAMFAWYASINVNAGTAPFLFDRSGLGRFSAYNYPVSADLRAERVNTHNIGADASFLGGRLDASMDLYYRKVSDMINPKAVISAVFGDTAPLMNQGSLSSFGADLSLGWNDVWKDMSYSLKAMFSDHTAAVSGLPDPRMSYVLHAGVAWKGADFGVHADGTGSLGIFCIRDINAGYTFDLSRTGYIKSLRIGAAARNIFLSGMKYPVWALVSLSAAF